MIKKKEEQQQSIIDRHNNSIQTLAKDISNSIDSYIKRGDINFATVIGVLEDIKTNISVMSREASSPKDRVTLKVDESEYIG